MNTRLQLPGALLAAAVAFAAAPALACSLVPMDDRFIARAVRDDGSIWIGRVTAITEDPQPADRPFGPTGQARVAAEQRLRGGTPIPETNSRYDKHPFCGYPWAPRVGDRVLVVKAFNFTYVLSAEQAARTRYKRHFIVPPPTPAP